MTGRFGKVLGGSDAMRPVYDLLERIVDASATVLVTGESGTGKEVVARALHDLSRHKSGPFVAINRSAVPGGVAESELRSRPRRLHRRAGAADRPLPPGAGRHAPPDEIGDMPMSLQPKLCGGAPGAHRAAGRRRRGGAVRHAHRRHHEPDLRALVDEQRFREDLYFRVNVINVVMPPLRARGGDVLVLAQHFVDLHAARSGKSVTGLAPAAAERLLAYPWPGNVRELQNCIERAIALTRRSEIQVEDLPETVRQFKRSHVLIAASDPSELVPLDEVERRYVLRVVEAAGGNKSLAAQILGITRKTLYRKLGEYGAAEDG